MATSAPSQFAQLLSRSKFVTYDPCISQIYTSHGGFAYRGQFGLKRPLPKAARKRHPLVTIKSVDTPSSQTDWDPAHETGGNWMKMWKEVGAGAEADSMGSWTKNLPAGRAWEMDSDFDQSKAAPAMIQGAQAAWKNTDPMTPKQFEKYLDELRKQRPEFKRYLDDRRAEMHGNKASEGKGLASDLGADSSSLLPPLPRRLNMADLARSPSAYHVEFLADKANAEQQLNPKSTQISPKPHPNAGLSYTHRNVFQESILYPAQPGRLVSRTPTPPSPYGRQETVALVAGNVTNPETYGSSRSAPLTFSELENGKQALNTGEVKLRVSVARVKSAPEVVSSQRKPKIGLGLRGDNDVDLSVGPLGSKMIVNSFENRPDPSIIPHRIGTPEYVAYKEPLAGSKAVPTSFWASQVMGLEAEEEGVQKDAPKHVRDVLNLVTGLIRNAKKP